MKLTCRTEHHAAFLPLGLHLIFEFNFGPVKWPTYTYMVTCPSGLLDSWTAGHLDSGSRTLNTVQPTPLNYLIESQANEMGTKSKLDSDSESHSDCDSHSVDGTLKAVRCI